MADIIREHPELGPLYEAQVRRGLARQYDLVFASLHLTPDQIAQLKGLLTEKQMTATDAQQAATAAGLLPGSPAWRAALQQAGQDVEQQIDAVLQPLGINYAQLQARSGLAATIQNDYGLAMADAGAPLSSEQRVALLNAMAEANYAGKDFSQRPAGYNTPDASTGLTPHQSLILQTAAASLAPAQLQVIQQDDLDANQRAAIMKQYAASGATVRQP